jgi:hypothetical protein
MVWLCTLRHIVYNGQVIQNSIEMNEFVWIFVVFIYFVMSLVILPFDFHLHPMLSGGHDFSIQFIIFACWRDDEICEMRAKW